MDKELASLRLEQARLTARIEGLRAERDALSEAMTIRPVHGSSGDQSLATLTKNEAIVAVLVRTDTPLRVKTLVALMNEAGRNECEQHVWVYLSNLVKQGRVRRVQRGLYAAA